MNSELSLPWAEWRDRRVSELIAEGTAPEVAVGQASLEAEARQRLAAVAGVDVAMGARVVAATGPSGQPGARVQVDLATVTPERREAVRQAVSAEARRETVR